MALTDKASTFVCIPENQTPAEKRFGLNLLISMFRTDKYNAGETFLRLGN
jgi:hypothetical protein